jgi:hypothetical protein
MVSRWLQLVSTSQDGPATSASLFNFRSGASFIVAARVSPSLELSVRGRATLAAQLPLGSHSVRTSSPDAVSSQPSYCRWDASRPRNVRARRESHASRSREQKHAFAISLSRGCPQDSLPRRRLPSLSPIETRWRILRRVLHANRCRYADRHEHYCRVARNAT